MAHAPAPQRATSSNTSGPLRALVRLILLCVRVGAPCAILLGLAPLSPARTTLCVARGALKRPVPHHSRRPHRSPSQARPAPGRTLRDVTRPLTSTELTFARSTAVCTTCRVVRRARDHGHAGLALSPVVPFAHHAPPRLGQEGRALLLPGHHLLPLGLRLRPDIMGRVGGDRHWLHALEECLDRCVLRVRRW